MDSKAAFESAVAALKIARKALDDTCLRAPFAGVVADTYVDNFQNIQAKVSVLSLQEIDRVEIVVSVPEERVIRAPRSDDDPADPAERGERANEHYRFAATLEYLPNREFDVRFKEFTSEADPVTRDLCRYVRHASSRGSDHSPGDDGGPFTSIREKRVTRVRQLMPFRWMPFHSTGKVLTSYGPCATPATALRRCIGLTYRSARWSATTSWCRQV